MVAKLLPHGVFTIRMVQGGVNGDLQCRDMLIELAMVIEGEMCFEIGKKMSKRSIFTAVLYGTRWFRKGADEGGWTGERDLFIITSGHAVLSHNVTGKASYGTGLAPPKHQKCAGMALFAPRKLVTAPGSLPTPVFRTVSPQTTKTSHTRTRFSALVGGSRGEEAISQCWRALHQKLTLRCSTSPRHLAKNDDRDSSSQNFKYLGHFVHIPEPFSL